SEIVKSEWFKTRKPIIQVAVRTYPPGYYLFDGEKYKLFGWSEPREGETEPALMLRRYIPDGTVEIRVKPDNVTVYSHEEEREEVITPTMEIVQEEASEQSEEVSG